MRASIGYTNSAPSFSCCEQLQVNGSFTDSDCRLVFQGPATAVSYEDTGLGPFFFYQYCVIVRNGAGSAYSDFSEPTQTDPAPVPLAGPTATAVAINSTAIEVSWMAPDIHLLLGPVSSYTLYMSNNEVLGEVLFTGSAENFTVTGLLPSTEYTFRVSWYKKQMRLFASTPFSVMINC